MSTRRWPDDSDLRVLADLLRDGALLDDRDLAIESISKTGKENFSSNVTENSQARRDDKRRRPPMRANG